MDFRLIRGLQADKYRELLRRGWRRFGCEIFRPVCRGCRECLGLRVPLETFRASKSQRRIWRRQQHWRVEVGVPQVSSERLELYDAHHAAMSEAKGWPYRPVSESYYHETFVEGGGTFAREFRYFDGARLIAVGMVDQLSDALSSVYFFHAPDQRAAAPGVFSVLWELEYARQQGLRHLYLGYWIRDCESMNYKSRYRPCEVLREFPEDDQEPQWEWLEPTQTD